MRKKIISCRTSLADFEKSLLLQLMYQCFESPFDDEDEDELSDEDEEKQQQHKHREHNGSKKTQPKTRKFIVNLIKKCYNVMHRSNNQMKSLKGNVKHFCKR